MSSLESSVIQHRFLAYPLVIEALDLEVADKKV